MVRLLFLFSVGLFERMFDVLESVLLRYKYGDAGSIERPGTKLSVAHPSTP